MVLKESYYSTLCGILFGQLSVQYLVVLSRYGLRIMWYENWSAFAPDFKELDENVEYEEKESEFDIEDEDKEEELHSESEAGEEEEVDVTTIERIPALCSSDEENDEELDQLAYLPVAPEIDDPEEPQWGTTEVDDYSRDPEQKRRATQDTGAEAPKKKVKVIDIRHDPNEPSIDSKRTGPQTTDSSRTEQGLETLTSLKQEPENDKNTIENDDDDSSPDTIVETNDDLEDLMEANNEPGTEQT
ncbi:hypothetical protein QZH41_012231 [Actinostola sp. cb2023]|nr:hypothetical protein QZH41_012231 [Actinostola sp. cb2023]